MTALIPLLTALLLPGFAGEKAKNFRLPDLGNKKVQLSKLLEDGPVLLDFWATWCKPCIKAMPKLEKLHQRFKDRGFRVVGINADCPRNQAKVKPFVKSLKVSFPILLDLEGSAQRDYRAYALPTSVLISGEGEILMQIYGYQPEKMTEIEGILEKLLADKSHGEAPTNNH